MNSLELEKLFAEGLKSVEGILPEEGPEYVIQEELKIENLSEIIKDAMAHSKAVARPLSVKQWAESRKANFRVKPSRAAKKFRAAIKLAVDLKPAIEDFENENIIGSDAHVLLRIDDQKMVAWSCSAARRGTLEILSYGFPRHCPHCDLRNPLESLLGETIGEECF
jgi:hypothetical protein